MVGSWMGEERRVVVLGQHLCRVSRRMDCGQGKAPFKDAILFSLRRKMDPGGALIVFSNLPLLDEKTIMVEAGGGLYSKCGCFHRERRYTFV